ncbi:MAG: NAD(P)-dependent oxidoreductase [Bilophila wadsworthia]
MAHLLELFGVNVGYHDPFADVPGYTRLELDDLMGWRTSSCIAPRPKTAPRLLDLAASLMRPGSIILNIARGGLIDEIALLGLLTAGHLAGAALDCFTKEPYDGPLKEMDNVILTPHIGSYAKEARIIMETDTIKNLLDVLFPGA